MTINFSTNQTVVTQQSGGSTTTTAVNSMSGLVAIVGSNPIFDLSIRGNGAFTWDVNPSGGVTNFTITDGSTLTGPAYTSGDGRAAVLGNGHLVMSISGTMTINSGASINMDARGYTQNLSYQGTNTGGAGRRAYCSAGGGSYGTSGGSFTLENSAVNGLAGSSFGDSDFWVNLYLGSGGADNLGYYNCDSYGGSNGGNGGGAISISAASISNAGVISARGQNSEFGGSGSGGTIVVNVSENFTNTGTISAAGGTTGGVGGNGRVKLVYSSGSSGTVIGEQ